jgi:hypothetical protein
MSPTRTVLAACAAALAAGLAGCGDGGGVDASPADLRRETTAQLAEANARQRVCFGWRLDSTDPTETSRGSNLGDNVPVDSNPGRCPRWVEVSAMINYVSSSSESEDSAVVDVRTSPDINTGPTIRDNLARFGLDEKAFVDDPTWAVSRAALALPLLTAESGAAEPVPTAAGPATAPPSPLPSAGSDFWRDRLLFVLAAASIVLVAVVFGVIGLVLRRRRTPGVPVVGQLR